MNVELSTTADLLAISYIKWEQGQASGMNPEQLKPIRESIEYYKDQVTKEIVETLRPDIMKLISSPAETEKHDTDFLRKAKFEALRNAPTRKLTDINPNGDIMTADEIVAEAEKIYNWLIK
jgi:hypothetical protein